MPLGPLRIVCVQPAPKSRLAVSGIFVQEDQKHGNGKRQPQTANGKRQTANGKHEFGLDWTVLCRVVMTCLCTVVLAGRDAL
jgi:hypothetical protein